MTTTFGSVVRGVAIGDAWGNPIEFQQLASIVSTNPKGPEQPKGKNAMWITDDTQMTLYLADALDLTRNDDIPDVKRAIMDAFREYKRDPEFSHGRAPGGTVSGSLSALGSGYNWKAATNKNSDGSGTAMRTHATAFLPEDRWVGATAFAAAVTHGSPNAIAAAILQAAVLRDIMAGLIPAGGLVEDALYLAQNADTLGLTATGTWLEDFEVDLLEGFDELARLLVIAKENLPAFTEDPWAFESSPSDLIGGGGWRGHETVVIAFLSVDMIPNDPMDALRRSIVGSGDSDTVGAVTGALLGALSPGLFVAEWEKSVENFEPRYVRWIEQEADDYEFTPEPDPEELIEEAALVEEIDEAAAEQDSLEPAENPAVVVEEPRRSLVKRLLRSFR
jgi:ADP-ribosylglycohydrolase